MLAKFSFLCAFPSCATHPLLFSSLHRIIFEKKKKRKPVNTIKFLNFYCDSVTEAALLFSFGSLSILIAFETKLLILWRRNKSVKS